MKTEHIFFVLGIIFLFATVSYFSYEYIFNLTDAMKTIILAALIVAFFSLANFLQEKDI